MTRVILQNLSCKRYIIIRWKISIVVEIIISGTKSQTGEIVPFIWHASISRTYDIGIATAIVFSRNSKSILICMSIHQREWTQKQYQSQYVYNSRSFWSTHFDFQLYKINYFKTNVVPVISNIPSITTKSLYW